MGRVRQWLRERLAAGSSTKAAGVNLLEEPSLQLDAPSALGLDTRLAVQPWSLARLAAIFRDVRRGAEAEQVRDARHARHRLSAFWLSAPVDLLEELYGGAVGDVQRLLLESPLPRQPLAADERLWRDQLAQQLAASFEERQRAAQRLNLLLAVMPYFGPRKLQIADALDQLPAWLLDDYIVYCEPELQGQVSELAGYLKPAADQAAAPAPSELQPLCERRGEAAMEWFQSEAALKRMEALIQLFSLQPDDPETLQELAGLRQVIAQLWLDVDERQLQQLYATPMGAVYRALIRSGFSGQVVDPIDQRARQQLAPLVENLAAPGAINAVLAVLLFYPLGAVSFEGGVQHLPAWLRQELQSL